MMNHGGSYILSPTRTVVTSFTPRRPIHHNTNQHPNEDDICTEYDDGDWVLCIASSSYDNTIACALSNGSIQLYDTNTMVPIFSTQYVPHIPHTSSSLSSGDRNPIHHRNDTNPIMITDLIYGPEHTIVTTATNGVVIVSDIRVPAVAAAMTNQTTTPNPVIRGWIPESALCLSIGYDNYCVAIGTEKGRIRFIDLRKAGELIGSYVDSHTDAITQVKFHPHDPHVLLSGSEDGLMCLFDTKQPTEELAIQSIMNVTTSIRKVGFCSSSSSSNSSSNIQSSSSSSARTTTTPLVYCLTGSETMSIWDTNTATCQCHFDHWNLRQHLTNQMHTVSSSSAAVSLSAAVSVSAAVAQEISNQSIDYLIDVYWDDSSHELQLAAGTNSGDVVLYTCTENNNQIGSTNILSSSSSSLDWKVNHILHGGHKGIVRGWCPLIGRHHHHQGIVVTAGEDARLCEWNRGYVGKQFTRTSFGQTHHCSSSSFSSHHYSSSSSFDDGWMIHPNRHQHHPNRFHDSFSSSSLSLLFHSNPPQPQPQHRITATATTDTSTMDVSRGGGPIRGRNQRRHKQMATPY
jgi:WD40 repeat protein